MNEFEIAVHNDVARNACWFLLAHVCAPESIASFFDIYLKRSALEGKERELQEQVVKGIRDAILNVAELEETKYSQRRVLVRGVQWK